MDERNRDNRLIASNFCLFALNKLERGIVTEWSVAKENRKKIRCAVDEIKNCSEEITEENLDRLIVQGTLKSVEEFASHVSKSYLSRKL
jgi:hypothetical protein